MTSASRLLSPVHGSGAPDRRRPNTTRRLHLPMSNRSARRTPAEYGYNRHADLMGSQAERVALFEAMDPAKAAPLDSFSLEHQERIAAMVADPRPPDPWLDFGLCAIPSRAWFEWYWQRGTRPGQHRRKIPAHVRRVVTERDGMVCQLCFGEVTLDALQLDHIVPYASGGRETVDNLRVAHASCNARRGAPLA